MKICYVLREGSNATSDAFQFAVEDGGKCCARLSVCARGRTPAGRSSVSRGPRIGGCAVLAWVQTKRMCQSLQKILHVRSGAGPLDGDLR